jgi:recombination protein RecA
MSRRDKLKAFAASVEKKYGERSLDIGLHTIDMKRVPTGSVMLDLALGGGLPVGRVSMFYGAKSSGKTTTAYRIAAQAQTLCANCLRPATFTELPEEERYDEDGVEQAPHGFCDCYAKGLIKPRQSPDEKKPDFAARLKAYEANSYERFWVAIIDLEGAYDHRWATKLGLKSYGVVFARPGSAEEAIDVVDQLVRTGAVDLVIIDSIAAMTPSKEIEESVENWQQGLQARLVNKFCRKIQSTINDVSREFGRAPTQLWINQVREKIGVMFGSNETLPGGRGQGFVTSVEVKLWANDYKKGKAAGLDYEVATGVRINFKVEKNKTAPPKRTGSYLMSLDDGAIDDAKLLIDFAEGYGIFSKEDKEWEALGVRFKTKRDATEYLLKPENVEHIKGLMLEACV